jgi:hypothetical protein
VIGCRTLCHGPFDPAMSRALCSTVAIRDHLSLPNHAEYARLCMLCCSWDCNRLVSLESFTPDCALAGVVSEKSEENTTPRSWVSIHVCEGFVAFFACQTQRHCAVALAAALTGWMLFLRVLLLLVLWTIEIYFVIDNWPCMESRSTTPSSTAT